MSWKKLLQLVVGKNPPAAEPITRVSKGSFISLGEYTTASGQRTSYEISDSNLGKHLFICGQNSAGVNALKSNIAIQQASKGGGALIVDSYRNNALIAGVKNANAEALIMSDTAAGTATYLPLLHGDPFEMADILLEKTKGRAVAVLPKKSLPLLAFILICISQTKGNFIQVDASELTRLLISLENISQAINSATGKCRQVLAAFESGADSDEKSEIIDELVALGQGLASSQFIAAALSKSNDEFTFREVFSNNKVLYFIKPVTLSDLDEFILSKDLRASLFTRTLSRKHPPFLFFPHNFGSDMAQSVEQARSRNVGLIFAGHPSSLLNADHAPLSIILANTETKVLFNMPGDETAHRFVSMLGGPLTPHKTDNDSGQILDSEALRGLHLGEALVICSGVATRLSGLQ